MWPWRSSRRSAAALAEPPVAERPSVDVLRRQIDALTAANRTEPTLDQERQLLQLRHQAGISLLDQPAAAPRFATPDSGALPAGTLSELTPAELTPGLLRAAVLRDGCALVRGLLKPSAALALAGEIDRAYEARESANGDSAHYEEFEPDRRFGPVMWRPWIREGGGLLAVDSPRACFRMLEDFQAAGVPALVSGYLGEPAVLSVHKTTLRKADPSVSGAWHQDGAFMGPVRSLNLWLSLSRCGDEAPGLDIVPVRLEQFVATGTEGAALNWTISDDQVEAAASGHGVLRPIFEPGDALFFDELFLHRTGSDPAMPDPRFAVESWFFGPSAFPADYAPLAA